MSAGRRALDLFVIPIFENLPELFRLAPLASLAERRPGLNQSLVDTAESHT